MSKHIRILLTYFLIITVLFQNLIWVQAEENPAGGVSPSGLEERLSSPGIPAAGAVSTGTVSDDSVPAGTVSSDSALNDSVSGSSALNGSASNGSASNDSASNGSASNGSASYGSASNGSAPNGSAPNGSASYGSAPNSSASDDSSPNGSAASPATDILATVLPDSGLDMALAGTLMTLKSAPTAEWLLIAAPDWTPYEVLTGTPINEIDDSLDLIALGYVGWCWVQNTSDPDDIQRTFLDVVWDTSAYQADVPGTYVITGTLGSYADTLGNILNPDNIQAQITVTVSDPKVPAFSDQIYTSEDTLYLHVPLLYRDWDIRVYRSDDRGTTWYDFTASEQLQIYYEQIVISDLNCGEWLGIKVEVAGGNLLLGTSLPIFVRLEDGGSFSLDWEGDRGGAGYSVNPPRNTEPDPKPASPSLQPDASTAGTETENIVMESTLTNTVTETIADFSLETTLSAAQLRALTQVHPRQIPFVAGDFKLLIPTSAFQALNLKKDGLVAIKAAGNSSAFHISITADTWKGSAEISLPFTLYIPYIPPADTNTALLLYKDGENGVMPYSYYDSRQQAMVLITGQTGQFTLFCDVLDHNESTPASPAVDFVLARGLMTGDQTTGGTFISDKKMSASSFTQVLSGLALPLTSYRPSPSSRPLSGKKALALLHDFSRKQGLTPGLTEDAVPVSDKILTNGQCAQMIKDYIEHATLS